MPPEPTLPNALAPAAPASPDAARIEALAGRVAVLADRRLDLQPVAPDARRRATQLRDHVVGHVIPRARSLDAPILVVLLGPTGAGKSTLLNTLVGRPISRTGVLRPTTRRLVAHVHPDDVAALVAEGGPLGAIDDDIRTLVEDGSARPGIVLADAPDIDSIEHANRRLADRLAEAADLAIFVTTATRYADRVPWQVLRRMRDRGLPIVVVLNRMPPDDDERREVVADVRRLLDEAGLALADPDGAGPLEILGIAEGDIRGGEEMLEPSAVAPIRERIDHLAGSGDARRELAARALAGSLAGLAPLIDRIADDLAHEGIDRESLRRSATDHFGRELGALRDELARGAFLRETALRQWQEFVGADELTKLFSRGIGRVRGAIGSLVRGAPQAPIAEVRDDTLRDLVALAHGRADEAVRRTATTWSNGPEPGPALAAEPGAWSVSADFDERLRAALEGWVGEIGADIQATGASKRTLARGASLGVNGAGVAVMLATFSHTGGLTGAEVGVAAATAFLNQKLLSALFGEAAMVELIARARARLVDAMSGAFREELERFTGQLPDAEAATAAEADLRAVAGDLRALPPSIPFEAVGVVDGLPSKRVAVGPGRTGAPAPASTAADR